MKVDILAFSALASVACASALPGDARVASLLAAAKRATDQAPNDYAPASVDCPSTRPSIREATSLSSQEEDWLQTRRQMVERPLRSFLGRMNIAGINTNNYLDKLKGTTRGLPNVGLAFSGGGYRAMLNGGGALASFDERIPGSTDKGSLGGLLQSATHIAGLSGGSWLLGSIYVNNFTTIQDLIDTTVDESGNLWQLQNSILDGPEGGSISLLDTADYYTDLYDQVSSKSEAGFDTSLTDYWARALSFQFVNGSAGGPGFTWSSIADDADFQSGAAPLPLVVADGRDPGEKIVSLTSTVFEFTPWEMGSFDSTIFGFAPLKYLGSAFDGGKLPASEDCIAGVDNAGYVMGTSSSLFNQIMLQIADQDGVPDFLVDAITGVLGEISQSEDDIAPYSPNPFFNFNPGSNPSADSTQLTLVDGGEDLQNIPFQPLIQPERELDVVFAVDSSADTVNAAGANWPNGTSLVATYQRAENRRVSNGSHFPVVPDQNTMVNLGLNSHPTFFGCDVQNMTGPGPLVVYIPNAPYVFMSNTSTTGKLTYSTDERNAMIQNGWDVATQGNGTEDANWGTCVGCAILKRSLDRERMEIPDACASCFERYCWNGTIDDSTPTPYSPSPYLKLLEVSGGGRLSSPSSAMALVAAVAASFVLFV